MFYVYYNYNTHFIEGRRNAMLHALNAARAGYIVTVEGPRYTWEFFPAKDRVIVTRK